MRKGQVMGAGIDMLRKAMGGGMNDAAREALLREIAKKRSRVGGKFAAGKVTADDPKAGSHPKKAEHARPLFYAGGGKDGHPAHLYEAAQSALGKLRKMKPGSDEHAHLLKQYEALRQAIGGFSAPAGKKGTSTGGPSTARGFELAALKATSRGELEQLADQFEVATRDPANQGPAWDEAWAEIKGALKAAPRTGAAEAPAPAAEKPKKRGGKKATRAVKAGDPTDGHPDTPAELIAEHEHVIQVLKDAGTPEAAKEAERQQQELDTYREQAKAEAKPEPEAPRPEPDDKPESRGSEPEEPAAKASEAPADPMDKLVDLYGEAEQAPPARREEAQSAFEAQAEAHAQAAGRSVEEVKAEAAKASRQRERMDMMVFNHGWASDGKVAPVLREESRDRLQADAAEHARETGQSVEAVLAAVDREHRRRNGLPEKKPARAARNDLGDLVPLSVPDAMAHLGHDPSRPLSGAARAAVHELADLDSQGSPRNGRGREERLRDAYTKHGVAMENLVDVQARLGQAPKAGASYYPEERERVMTGLLALTEQDGLSGVDRNEAERIFREHVQEQAQATGRSPLEVEQAVRALRAMQRPSSEPTAPRATPRPGPATAAQAASQAADVQARTAAALSGAGLTPPTPASSRAAAGPAGGITPAGEAPAAEPEADAPRAERPEPSTAPPDVAAPEANGPEVGDRPMGAGGRARQDSETGRRKAEGAQLARRATRGIAGALSTVMAERKQERLEK